MLKLRLIYHCRLSKYIQLLLITIVAIIVTFIYRFPDVYAYFKTPPGMVYLGHNSWFDPHDVNVYVSAIHYGQRGNLLLANLWSAIPNQPIVIFPIEVISGYIFRSVNPFFLLWLTGIICGILLIVGIFLLLHKVGLNNFLAAATTLGITLSGGFGFILYPNIPSSDITYAITFYEAFYKPHEAISLLFYIVALVFFFKIITDKKRISLIKIIPIAISLVISLLIYPYLIANYLFITAPFIYINRTHRTTKDYIYLSLIYIPAGLTVLFMAWQMSLNQGFADPLIQHLNTSLLPTFLGYGILLPIFCYQLFFMKKTPLIWYLSWWILATFILALLPFGPGKIFLRGMFFPLVLLAVLQIQTLMRNLGSAWIKISFWTIFFLLLSATSIYIMFLRNHAALSVQSTDIIYMPEEEYKIFSYLNTHTPIDSGVLSARKMSYLIPAFTQNRSCVGSMGSANGKYARQLNNVYKFYAGSPPTNDYLQHNNISYVLWGPEEQTLTGNYPGDTKNLTTIYKNLKLVYMTKTMKLYKVISR